MIKIFGIIITYDEFICLLFAAAFLCLLLTYITILWLVCKNEDKNKNYDINHKTIKDIKVRKEDK